MYKTYQSSSTMEWLSLHKTAKNKCFYNKYKFKGALWNNILVYFVFKIISKAKLKNFWQFLKYFLAQWGLSLILFSLYNRKQNADLHTFAKFNSVPLSVWLFICDIHGHS